MLALALPAPVLAAAPQEVAERQADLSELRSRIEALRQQISTGEEYKANAADRLRDSERQISSLQRDLHDLGEQRIQLQRTLATLERQSKSLSTTLDQQQAQLENLLYRQYLRGNPDALRLLLNGDDPNQAARDLHYLSVIATARAEMMRELNGTLERKKAIAADTRERAGELQDIESARQKRQGDLKKQRDEHKMLYARISETVANQRKEIGTLEKDEKRLAQLVEQLSRIIAQQRAAEAARAARAAEAARALEAARSAEAARAAEARKHREKAIARLPDDDAGSGKVTPPAAEPSRSRSVELENRLEPVASDSRFARQKGSLRLPVRGAVKGRFGGPREGGGTWRGLFIKTVAGSEVKSVAGGRVVFAEWMRGFGNLLIVDHGDAYLSIYGNNDALLKQVGQDVQGGEAVATVGNSGGNPETGLYFELRHQGHPIDPMKWASLR
jgi:septal ring factor EnvC (AmiA/AmiB activator)